MKTVHVLTAEGRCEAVDDLNSALITEALWKAEGLEVTRSDETLFGEPEIVDIHWDSKTELVTGHIQVTANDSLEFKSFSWFNVGEVIIDELLFAPILNETMDYRECINLPKEARLHLQTLIHDRLCQDYEPDMYAAWQESQRENHLDIQES